MTTQKQNSNLTHINNLDDLQAEIRSVKVSVKTKEQQLAQRLDRLPQETVKATLGVVIPLFLNNSIAGKTWEILRASGGLLFGKKSGEKEDIKGSIFSSAKKLGLFAVLKAGYNLWQKR